MHEEIDKILNEAVGGSPEIQIAAIRNVIAIAFPLIGQNYDNSRKYCQFLIDRLEKFQEVTVFTLFTDILDKIQQLAPHFSTTKTPTMDLLSGLQDLNHETIFTKAFELLGSQPRSYIRNDQIANALSHEERLFIINFVNEFLSSKSLESQWSAETIKDMVTFLTIAYPICHKENAMDLYYNMAYNFLDRVAYSQEPQHARDIAENLLIIGHNEGQLADAYLGASRAYTAVNNIVGGLVFLLFSLESSLYGLKSTGTGRNESLFKTIPQIMSRDMLWQALKLMRLSGRYIAEWADTVIKLYNTLKCSKESDLWIYHTFFTLKLYAKNPDLQYEIKNFLDANRETFFNNLENGSLPWYTLFKSFRTFHKYVKNPAFELYEQAVNNIVKQNGNELIVDFHDGKNLDVHLKELLKKLETTRNRDDYSQDVHMAITVAKKLIDKAVESHNPIWYVLAMRPMSDFTFIMRSMPDVGREQPFTVQQVDGSQITIPYEDPRILSAVTGADENDAICWISRGSETVFALLLIREAWSFYKLPSWKDLNLGEIQDKVIAQLRFASSIKSPNAPVYVKAEQELRKETEELQEKLKDLNIEIPNIVQRLLIAKSLDLAAVPHQLITDSRTDILLGELLPTCNIISTELLIDTNFRGQLSEDYSRSFWTPTESGEFTFASIRGGLEDILSQNKFSISESLNPTHPISADLNIFCAHGASDIGNTHRIYANDSPIDDTRSIIGSGKILVLFVCHSGSIAGSRLDSAMHTIIKDYLRDGYSAVVAPMWSLSTEILPIWLKEFLNQLNDHQYIIDAVYHANMAVKSNWPSASAWACLHLFGNPYVQINDSPRLQLIRKDSDETSSSV